MEEKQQGTIRVSNIVFDIDNQVVYKNGQEFKAEFKVLELLSYLYSCSNRYVPLDELHEHVWQGKVVSDAAVRRVIGKLRALLDDNKAQPQFLVNRPKRGYRLFIEDDEPPSHADECSAPSTIPSTASPVIPPHISESLLSEHANTATDSPDVLATDHEPRPPLMPTATSAASNHRWIAFLLPLLFTAVICVLALWTAKQLFFTHSLLSEDELTLIPTIPADIRDMTISENGQLMAFSALVDGQLGYQLFIKDLQSGAIKQLTHGEHSVFSMVFVNHDRQLAFVNFIDGNASIQLLDVNKAQQQAPRVLLERTSSIGALAHSPYPNTVLAPLLDSRNLAFIFAVNFADQSLTQVTSNHLAQSIDSRAVVSPNNQRLAVLRSTGNNAESHLRIQLVDSGQLITEFRLTEPVFDLQWQDNSTLLLLNHQGLYSVNIPTHKRKLLMKNTHGALANFSWRAPNKLFLQKKTVGNKLVAAAGLSDIKEPLTTLPIAKNDVEVNFSNGASGFYVVSRDEDTYLLTQRDPAQNKSVPLYKNHRKISLLDSNKQMLVLKVGNRLAVFSLKNKAITFIPQTSDVIADAQLNTTGTSLYFTEQDAGQWLLVRYTLASGHKQRILSGYRSVRGVADGYFVADPAGQVYHYDALFEHRTRLPVQLSFERLYDWHATAGLIVWTTTDFNTTVFHRYQLATEKTETVTFPFDKFLPEFSLSTDGKKILYQSKSIDISKIYSAKL